jgi:hypothetical protein
MIKRNIYTSLSGQPFALAELDREERSLIDVLITRHVGATTWPEFRNFYIRAVDDLYSTRGLTRRQVTETSVWKIAQDLNGRVMIRLGLAVPPDYRDTLSDLIQSDFPTQKAFCDATGLAGDLVSHVLSKRKHLALDTLTDALQRIGYRLQIVPVEKA